MVETMKCESCGYSYFYSDEITKRCSKCGTMPGNPDIVPVQPHPCGIVPTEVIGGCSGTIVPISALASSGKMDSISYRMVHWGK